MHGQASNTDRMVSSFLQKYGETEFSHSQEVFHLLRNFETLAPRVSIFTARLTNDMRSGYRFRAEMASKNPSTRSPRLAADALTPVIE